MEVNLIKIARVTIGLRFEKGLSLDLATEQRADPSACNAEGMSILRFAGENEGVGEHAADGAGLDVRALRRRASATPLVPIGEHLADRCVPHERLSVLSDAVVVPQFGTVPPIFADAGMDEHGACRCRAVPGSAFANEVLVLMTERRLLSSGFAGCAVTEARCRSSLRPARGAMLQCAISEA
jgi:hypothetical protein